jgi:hypothetical protein
MEDAIKFCANAIDPGTYQTEFLAHVTQVQQEEKMGMQPSSEGKLCRQQ